MERRRVIEVLEGLADGATALSREQLDQPDVLRALFTAIEVLKSPAADPSRPAAAGARWTEEEDGTLCRQFDSGTDIPGIATLHNRTPGAITSRLVKLGRIDPATVQVRNRA